MNKVYLRFAIKTLLNYMGIALLVILLLFPIYRSAYNSAEDQINNDLRTSVSDNLNRLSSEKYSLSLYVDMLRGKDSLVKLSYLQDTNHAHIICARDLKALLNETLFSLPSLVDDVVVYTEASDYVISRARIVKKDLYYGTTIAYEGMSREEYESMLRSDSPAFIKHHNVYLGYLGRTEPTMVINYFSKTSAKLNYVISFLISEKKLTESLVPEDIKTYGKMVITDEQGNEFFVYDGGDTGSKPHIISVSSSNGDYTAQIYINDYVFSHSVQPVLRMIIIYIIIAVAASIVICLLLMFRMVASSKECITALARYFAPDDVRYIRNLQDYLRTITRNLSLRGYEFESKLRELNEQYTSSVLNTIAVGARLEGKEGEQALKVLSRFKSGYFVARMWMDTEQTPLHTRLLEEAPLRAGEELQNLFPGSIVYTDRRFLAIIPAQEEADALESKLTVFVDELKRKLGQAIQLSFAVSGAHTSPDDFALACKECRILQRNMPFMSLEDRELALWSAQEESLRTTDDDEESISFGAFKLDAFCTVLNSGNTKQCADFLDRTALVQMTRLSVHHPEQSEALYYVIADAMATTARRKAIEYRAPMYNQEHSCAQNYQTLRDDAVKLCGELNRGDDDGSVRADIINYINENFCQSDMCLKHLSERFALTTTYISHLIKSSTGRTYSEYIEQLRMTEAVRLLRETDMPVNEICTSLGYENTNTFFKAFKRNYNVSPGYFRANQ